MPLNEKRNRGQLKTALNLLADSKFRMTKTRHALLKAMNLQKGPFSAPQLVRIFAYKASCDPVTIYRSLPVFEKLGIIEKCDFSDDMAKYEWSLGKSKRHHHHHFVCRKCKKVESLDFCLVENQESKLKKMGYTGLSHRLEFSGQCPTCS